MIPYAAILATLVPSVTGVVIYGARRYLKQWAGWIACTSALLSVVFTLSLAPDVLQSHHDGTGPLIFQYAWIEPIDINFGFLVDVVSLPIGLVVATVSTIACFYSVKYMEGGQNLPEYYASLLLFTTGMIGVMFSVNLIQFYLFWELMLIPSYLLISLWGTSDRRLAIGFKYFLFTHVGALAMLLGILTIYAYTGSFNLVLLPTVAGTIPPSMVGMVLILMLIGFFVKMAVFPFHTWLPDAHSEAPTPISAMLSGIMVKAGAFGIARILLPIFGPAMRYTSDFLTILGIITIAYGGLMALAQTDIKRLLAYSTVSQLGYIVFGFGTVSTLGITGGLLHMVNHAISKSLLFMAAGIIMHQTGVRDLRNMGGLMEKMPMTSVTCIVGAFSLIGIPPLNGFWSEWMIFGGGLESGKILLTFLGVASTMITAGYYLWFVWRVFFGATPESLSEVKDPSIPQLVPLLVLATACILFGLLPGFLLAFIRPAAEFLSGFTGG